MRIFRRPLDLGSLLLIGLTGACTAHDDSASSDHDGAAPVGPPEAAGNGTNDSTDAYDFVVQVTSPFEKCTGAKLSCRQVLTAAHCVCARVPDGGVFVKKGSNDACRPQVQFECADSVDVVFTSYSLGVRTPAIKGSVNVHPSYCQVSREVELQ